MLSLVTGASGFLGGRLVQMLLEQGDDVVLLARERADLGHLPLSRLRVVKGDLANHEALEQAVTGVARIFHCAACSTDWADERTYRAANVDGTANLIAAAITNPSLERFVHVSTTDIYGYPLKPCDEGHRFRDAGLPYNQTKGMAEELVWRAARENGLPITIVRPATIYGPRGKDFTQEIAKLLRQRLMATIDNGTAPGGFIYVDTVAQAMIDVSLNQQTLKQAYNLADGSHTTWASYLKTFAAQLGVRTPWINLSANQALKMASTLEGLHRAFRLPGRPLLTRHAVLLLSRSQEFPIAKAQADFGFNPGVSIEEGIRRSVAWLAESAAAQR